VTGHPIAWPDPSHDDYLIAQISTGDLEAFCELYDRHLASAHERAVGICGAAAADEVLREAFAAVWNHSAECRDEHVVVAEWIDELVRVCADEATRIRVALPPRPVEGEEGARAVARAEARQAEGRRIGGLLESLPQLQRQVITLAFYGGMSHTEIAAQLGLPADTVRGRMRLGLQKLLEENEQQQA